ncbi:class I SAM-dependent methyltransferase [uncultured Hoeflea sp.]|uniref:class I SAM-dependent methyltransferase n=1 Tax=uncultured Hoeflea sp. TaxID=538666 RepID=UPI0030DDAC58
MKLIRSYPIIGAIAAQILAGVLVFAALLGLASVLDASALFWTAVVLQGVLAAMVTRLLGLPVWWVWIGLCFPAAMALALNVGGLPAWPFGVGFVVLYLFFSNTARERVPLYLTNRATTEALLTLMRQRDARRFIDLGSGLGGVVRALDGEDRRARGVETAPMVWLVSAILSKLQGRGRILRRDIWTADISEEDIVYAFLSPEPMPALFEKAKREMKPGSLLVSNSFAVPGVEPSEIWELSDRRKTRLYLYEMAVPAVAESPATHPG